MQRSVGKYYCRPRIISRRNKSCRDCINDFASPEAIIVTGTVLDESASNDLTVTVIATGLNSSLQTAANKPQNVRLLLRGNLCH